MPREIPTQVVFTNKARCRDCYRCLRVCPVKAIRMHDGQAFVVEDLCIACGTCMRECPQGAKSFRRDLGRATRLLEQGALVAASVAPSFPAAFSGWRRRRLPSALRKLGFAYVGETASGAYHVAQRTAELARQSPGRAHICSACPVVVSYVERYQPQLLDNLVPVVSPMIAHAKRLKAKLGPDCRVVFIGPCVAKKAEAQRPGCAEVVDCVLTFDELLEWFESEQIHLEAMEESDFDEQPAGAARCFPLAGGAARTASLTTDVLSDEVLAVSGAEDVMGALDELTRRPRAVVIEPLFCPHGCINGPALKPQSGVYSRRTEVLSYGGQPASTDDRPMVDLATAFTASGSPRRDEPSPERVREVLEAAGRSRPEDQLNCGACGYPTCRDKAIAVVRGMAEIEMCIPRMRHLAERRTDRIIETSPNGIVILDKHLNIISMNPTFRRFFMAGEALLGKPISRLMDPELFERLATGDEASVDVVRRHDKHNLVCREILYPLKDENQFVGIFVNITASQASQAKLKELRSQAALQARELLDHQVHMAQQIAKFLGDSTARSEELVEALLRQAQDDSEERRKKGDNWPWGTSTSR